MPNFLSKVISVLFHPLLIATYATIIAMLYAPVHMASVTQANGMRLLGIVLINTFLFPAFSVFLMWRIGIIDSLEMPTSKERIIPFISTMIFYIWGFTAFYKLDVPTLLKITLLGATIGVCVAFVINNFTKISIHGVGVGGLLGIALSISKFSYQNTILPICAAVLIAGLVGSARLSLKAHTQHQVFGGYLIGLAAQLVALRILG